MGSVDQASGAYFLVSEPSGILVDDSHMLSPQIRIGCGEHALPAPWRGMAIGPEQASQK
jgi:hypothetical protein